MTPASSSIRDTSATPDVWRGARRRLHLQVVGPRDGLQMEAAFVPTADKIALVNALSAAGLAKIEATAFVSPQAIPALRDAEVVLREIERVPGVVYTCLVPNRRGAERAIEACADELNLVMSASESRTSPARAPASPSATRAASYSDGDVGGSRPKPDTSAPSSPSQSASQLPLKPVCPVTRTRRPRQKPWF